MKYLLFTLVAMSSLNLMAAESALNSAALAGNYKLIKAKGEYAATYMCAPHMKVTVFSTGVYLEPAEHGFWPNDFYGKESACEVREGDIGPRRKTCISFDKNAVSRTDTQATSIVGYVSAKLSLKLNSQGNELIYQSSQTLVPMGIFGLGSDHEFKCLYQRQ